MNSKSIAKSIILAGTIIAIIGIVIYIFSDEDEEVEDIKNLIKEADRLLKESSSR